MIAISSSGASSSPICRPNSTPSSSGRCSSRNASPAPSFSICFFRLNDPTRRTILEMLRDKDMTAGEIAAKFDMSWPSVSHHLDLLTCPAYSC
ncbi:MAG TPA: ArsR family transcriptional regulator [Puia sp.]|nr:ArsR family transcriptional regulator [Puia sp.]